MFSYFIKRYGSSITYEDNDVTRVKLSATYRVDMYKNLAFSGGEAFPGVTIFPGRC